MQLSGGFWKNWSAHDFSLLCRKVVLFSTLQEMVNGISNAPTARQETAHKRQLICKSAYRKEVRHGTTIHHWSLVAKIGKTLSGQWNINLFLCGDDLNA